jgi:outer membrane protein assembly factor BamB
LTGVNLWKRERPKSANWTSPVLIPSASGMKVGLQSGKGLLCVDPRTGQEVWNYGEGASTVSSTTASDGLLYAPSHGITALQPMPGEKSPKQLWRSAQLRPGTASPVAHRGRLYLLNDAGVMTCANAADGARMWQLRLKGPFSATPIAAGSFLYCVNETGLVQVVDISGAEGTISSELALNGTVLCTPGVSDGAIFLRSDAKLWRLQGR